MWPALPWMRRLHAVMRAVYTWQSVRTPSARSSPYSLKAVSVSATDAQAAGRERAAQSMHGRFHLCGTRHPECRCEVLQQDSNWTEQVQARPIFYAPLWGLS